MSVKGVVTGQFIEVEKRVSAKGKEYHQLAILDPEKFDKVVIMCDPALVPAEVKRLDQVQVAIGLKTEGFDTRIEVLGVVPKK